MCVLVSIIKVTAVNVVLLICFAESNYAARQQYFLRVLFCALAYKIAALAFFSSFFSDKVSVALWHYPPHYPLLLCC